MGSYTSLFDFKRADGSYDFDGLHKARIANGETCTSCGAPIIFGGEGQPVTCDECKRMGGTDKTDHERRIRCPHCGHLSSPFRHYDDGRLLAEGEHRVSCDECGKDFEVITDVTYSFRSPARIEEPSDGA